MTERSLPEVSAAVKAHPTLARKADAIVAILKPAATPDRLRGLSREDWDALGERAGVGKPTPLVQAIVVEQVERMRGLLDA